MPSLAFIMAWLGMAFSFSFFLLVLFFFAFSFSVVCLSLIVPLLRKRWYANCETQIMKRKTH